MIPLCPCCASRQVRCRGILPEVGAFAGVPMEPALRSAALYVCADCGLQFRWPSPDGQELGRLYARSSSTVWETAPGRPPRPDHDRVRTLVAQACPRGRLLDVGCHDGAFLAAIEGPYERYGIEPMPRAAAMAEQAGVRVIGNSPADLARLDMKFDVITAIDVIEHVLNPLEFLAMLGDVLAPGGLLFVVTGTTDGPAWRFMGARYWYCSFPEHVSFINRRWLAHAQARTGLRLSVVCQFHRFPTGQWLTPLTDFAKNACYRVSPAMYFWFLRKMGRQWKSGPLWQSAADHIVVVARRPG